MLVELLNRVTARKTEDAAAKYRDLLRAGVENESQAAKLLQAAEAIGLGPEEVQRDHDLLRRVGELRQAVEGIDALAAQDMSARAALDAHNRDTAAIEDQRKARRIQLEADRQRAAYRRDQANAALKELEGIKREHGARLGL